jgi:hypothetical protein
MARLFFGENPELANKKVRDLIQELNGQNVRNNPVILDLLFYWN